MDILLQLMVWGGAMLAVLSLLAPLLTGPAYDKEKARRYVLAIEDWREQYRRERQVNRLRFNTMLVGLSASVPLMLAGWVFAQRAWPAMVVAAAFAVALVVLVTFRMRMRWRLQRA